MIRSPKREGKAAQKEINFLPRLCLFLFICLSSCSPRFFSPPPVERASPLPAGPNHTNPVLQTQTELPQSLPSSSPVPTQAGSQNPPSPQPAATPTEEPEKSPTEVPVRRISIDGPAGRIKSEISGLAWYGDLLILLPQYPDRVENALYALGRDELLAYLESEASEPLTPRPVRIETGWLKERIRGYEGFEAIAFHGSRAFIAIEANWMGRMSSYLVSGKVTADLSELILDPERLVEVPLDVQISNFSNEALVVYGSRLVVMYEANGTGSGAKPTASVYDFDLNPTGRLEMAPLEFRLTDASAADENGRFWTSNFFFLGDLRILPRSDPIAAQFGKGPTQANAAVVERLVEMQLPDISGELSSGQAVTFTGAPPIQMQLGDGQIPRNWEGLAHLEGHGFIIATDKFPETILAFVVYPD